MSRCLATMGDTHTYSKGMILTNLLLCYKYRESNLKNVQKNNFTFRSSSYFIMCIFIWAGYCDWLQAREPGFDSRLSTPPRSKLLWDLSSLLFRGCCIFFWHETEWSMRWPSIFIQCWDWKCRAIPPTQPRMSWWHGAYEHRKNFRWKLIWRLH